jgi:Ser/Thr protein kinase RdoA (MazF antagonist)
MPATLLLSTARQTLERYAPEYRALSAEQRTGGFSGAQILRVETPAGPYCLRRWPRESLPLERLRGLHRLLGAVHARGVREVAVPVAALDGATLVCVRERLWQLEPWLPGIADFRSRPTRVRLSAAMESLARWHTAAAHFDPNDAERQWFGRHDRAPSPAVVERLRLIYEWHAGRLGRLKQSIVSRREDDLAGIGERIVMLFERACPRVAGELESAQSLRVRLQPCLRDVWHDHVLFSDEEVTGLIDPSACRMENVATDLARLLGSLIGDDPPRWTESLEEYAGFRPLTDDEYKLVRTLERSGVLLSGLTWLDRHFLSGQLHVEPRRVNARLQEILVRLEKLADSL